ncbi:hypothetical protein B277_03088 [Janibacter hoylei PVAS-1]|uniref:Uncharacterized protein n=1 Tax=Janibacter hoylei PVAS-1 TaxID=1210046 RepID=K1EA74_9MICO|nr:hypothetical protein [Janibacter hoylei]EKA62277.1 hypothetical protein B277_03088 [Janibacter hoylei PVAS-1]RWU85758.1 hypothetical protein CWN80_01995 [Janibacter hoylei PVAS-1]
MTEDLIALPSVDDYASAFTEVKDKITPKQLELLRFHHAQPGRAASASTMARAVGFESFSAVNVQYGKLARLVAEAAGLELAEHVKVGALVQFVHPDQAANEHFLWLMRENVAIALENLGWVPRVSQYLYPELALKRLSTIE